MTLLIRRMILEVIPAVIELEHISFSLPWPERSFRFELTDNPTSRCWVAEVDRRVVGMVVGWLFVDEIHIATIATHPDFRRQGIGRKLLHHAIANSPELGIKNLVGCIFASNTASLRLFAGFGFEQWGYLPAVAEFESGSCDLVIMGRRVQRDLPDPTLPTPDRTAPRLNDVPSDHSSG